MNRWWAPVTGFFLLLVLLLGLTQLAANLRLEQSSWTELKEKVAQGEVAEVAFDGSVVRVTLKGDTDPPRQFNVLKVDDPSLLPLLEQQQVKVRALPQSGCNEGGLGAMLVLPLLMAAGVWFFLNRQGGPTRSAAAFGRSSATLVPEDGTGVTFADVAGVDEAAEELQEVVQFLTTPEKFTALGGRPPKGVLLVGPPGTGKTLLARAVAGEAGVPFFSISGSAFVEMFVGVGAARVRDLFKTANDHAPCIIFVDELDAVGKARSAAGPAGNEEREQTLNQLLVEMDGFDNRRGIIVMAATNRPETLDQALLRPGRFDRQVVVDRPDVRGREAILRVHGRNLKLDPSVDLADIAKQTPGFAGADLANALNEAALLAARRDHSTISPADITDAIERTVVGLERKNRRLSEREKRVVAYHECGHALCAAGCPGADPVKKISIIPRGVGALGYTLQLPQEDRYLMSKAELLDRITVLFGGRVAEELVFGDVTTGAQDDIRRATSLARRLVVEYGMSKEVGPVSYVPQADGNPFGLMPSSGFSASNATSVIIETEVRRLLDLCYERARSILTENRPLLEEMSLLLLDKEVLEGDTMRSYLERAALAETLAEPPTAEISP